MEDFHEYEGLFSTWMNLLTPDELKQIKLKKYELQRIFPDVKKSFIDEMAQHKMLELMSHVPMDQWPAIETVDQDLQQTKEKVVQVNARLEELQDQLEDVILSAQMNYHETKTRLTSLEAKMAEASEKRALLEEKEAKHSQAICKMEERNIPSEKFKDHLQQQRITLSKIEPCKKETEAVMASLKNEIERLRAECSARENSILELKSYVTMKEREKQERDKEFTVKSECLSPRMSG
ncbi:hypothetical protein BSL78_09010 [Apostichopus japonicus]|uniref:Uncharacterized protein n=1 Tax=Stichopus japonicus TaxID=307972 RepID=A0A2G8L1I2_STIJA|nr:hypothetical protein BSL78_09010 [Apostichopus japonicus]